MEPMNACLAWPRSFKFRAGGREPDTSAACSSSAPTNPVEKSESAGVKTRAMARASARDREGRSGECRDMYRW